MLVRLGISTAAVSLVLTGCGGSDADSGDSTPKVEPIKAIALYTGADRMDKLIAGAKKEGTVQLYTSGILTSATGKIIEEFQDKYEITVEVVRASNDEIAARAIREAGAKQYLVDVFETTGVGIRALADNNLLTAYASPELADFAEDAQTKNDDGTIATVVRESYHGLGWNTDLIAAKDVPDSYEDILNPNLKGKLAIPDAAEDTIGAYLEAKGPEYVDSLKDMDIQLQSVSARQLADLVISGEVAMSLDLSSAHVAASKDKGAPIAWKALEPVPTNDGSVAVASHAAHPNAAMLLADYFLSKDAADIYSEFFYGTPRAGVESPNSLDPSIKRFYAARLDDYEAKIAEWRDLMLNLTQN
jgi:iron(III) transport system substrate-binding protein